MGEGWLTQMMSDRWLLAIGVYFLGLLTGWIIWKRRNADQDAGTAAGEDSTHKPEMQLQNEQQEKLAALAAEIENAQKMLKESEEESGAYRDLLKNLDDAVKRANGRLKLIVKSIKRR
jgi:type VI protein secretion system component VasK